MSDAWDVIVVGAGPAGAMAAHAAARRGARVLLVDKATFPRGKVCGCCVNAAALAALERGGLGALAARCGAVGVNELMFAARGRRATLQLPQGVVLSREALDAALLKEAMAAGAAFMPGVHARLAATEKSSRQPTRTIYIGGRPHTASVVVAADGLGGTLLDGEPGMDKCIARRSRMGAGAILDDAPGFYRSGRVYMACARHGYVGLVRLEDGRLDVAAAFDVPFVRACGSPGGAAQAVLRDAGMRAVGAMAATKWHGTPALTRRRRRVAGHRVLVAGDAAGYVEPFTGEGIAWALATGWAAGQLAVLPWDAGVARAWEAQYRRITARRRWLCRAVTLALRRPWLTRAALLLLAARPGLAWPMLRGINAPACEAP